MRKKTLNYSKTFFEIFLIAFAVFLGLLVGQWKENYENKKLAKENIENIYNELIENKTTIEKYLKNHGMVLNKFNNVLLINDNENILKQKKSDYFFDFELLNNSAWSTAKLSQSVSYMDFDLVKNISTTYSFQEQYSYLINDHIKRVMYQIIYYDSTFEYHEFIIDRNLLSNIIQYESTLLDLYISNINLIENKIRTHNNTYTACRN